MWKRNKKKKLPFPVFLFPPFSFITIIFSFSDFFHFLLWRWFFLFFFFFLNHLTLDDLNDYLLKKCGFCVLLSICEGRKVEGWKEIKLNKRLACNYADKENGDGFMIFFFNDLRNSLVNCLHILMDMRVQWVSVL